MKGPVLNLIDRVDQRALSEFAGRLADSESLAPFLKLAFRMRYWPRMRDAARPRDGYRTFNDLFARELRKGARPIADVPFVSPADGRYGQSGVIERGTLVQAKGKSYQVQALVGGDADLAAEFEGGTFVTVYLSPRDYHRFHAPCDGQLVRVVVIPGRLFPVNRGAVSAVDELFVRNERTIYVLETELGPVVLAAVAAFLVAGVVVTAAPVPAAPDRDAPFSHTFHKPATITRGQELGYFRFGSTVVALASREYGALRPIPLRSVSRVGAALSENAAPRRPAAPPRPSVAAGARRPEPAAPRPAAPSVVAAPPPPQPAPPPPPASRAELAAPPLVEERPPASGARVPGDAGPIAASRAADELGPEDLAAGTGARGAHAPGPPLEAPRVPAPPVMPSPEPGGDRRKKKGKRKRR